MELTLEPDEARLLREVLTNHLADLRSEIAHTERFELREELKRDEELIKRLLGRLPEPGAVPTA
ncbi:MAG TPA: hypothetical protein VFC93_04910 [Chloroflexota bacterium]|jgi:hypothetical protein|nr:hypothetical protein [Chloroflexota bacterium]